MDFAWIMVNLSFRWYDLGWRVPKGRIEGA